MPPKKTIDTKPARKTPSRSQRKHPRKKRQESYSVYIYRVLKQVHPETGISKKSMMIMIHQALDSVDLVGVSGILTLSHENIAQNSLALRESFPVDFEHWKSAKLIIFFFSSHSALPSGPSES